MKKTSLLPFLASLALTAGLALPLIAADTKTTDQVTVTFHEPESFTDVLENGSSLTSTYYLEQLRECLLTAATPLLEAGQKLVITFTDIDLAGETRFNQPHQIRIMKDIYAPRVVLNFRLLGSDGKVMKEGERKLVDQNYMMQVRRPGSDQPLYYDKQLLTSWLETEFKGRN